MAPSPSSISTQLRQLIYYHLDNNNLQNALFLSERLSASDRSGESTYLVSLCHLRLGDNKTAQDSSKHHGTKGAHLGCSYVYAQACLALEDHKEGILALEKCRNMWSTRNGFGRHSASKRDTLPDAAAVNCLLGKLYYGYDDRKAAIKCYEESLKQNPFMWDAFTSLCDMGCTVRVGNIFKGNVEMEEMLKSMALLSSDATSSKASKDASLTALSLDHSSNRSAARSAPATADSADPFNSVPARGFGGGLFSSLGLSSKSRDNGATLTGSGSGCIGLEGLETPTGPSPAIDVSVIPAIREPGVVSAFTLEPPQAPARRNRTLQTGMDFSMDAPPRMSRAISMKRPGKNEPGYPAPGDLSETSKASTLPTTGGKRTNSGQVVQPRQAAQGQSEDSGAPQRRSARIIGRGPSTTKPPVTSANAVGTREIKKKPSIFRSARPATSSTVGRVVSGNRKPVEDAMDLDAKEIRPHQQAPTISRSQTAPPIDPAKNEAEALQWLLDLFRKLGYGYFNNAQYKCENAIEVLSTLPQAHQNTTWVLAQMGRAHYEQAHYSDAEAYYKRIQSIAPTRHQDMEIYSTSLWHLKNETDLAFLAHELIEADWHSPQAWCALGNAWSLARDHEAALRCFKRATQLNPKFAYAYTLQGHEHIANEEFDKALSAYRQAMSADRRHYNAYYGIGRVYEKLGDYDKALQHYVAASQINQTNAVLICCIGTVYEKQKQQKLALKYFSKATELAPKSALTRFKKARALMALGELEVALHELMTLKDLAPDEAMVHFLLGKLYKGLREKGNAVKHFTIALNLDPKVSLPLQDLGHALRLCRRASKSRRPLRAWSWKLMMTFMTAA